MKIKYLIALLGILSLSQTAFAQFSSTGHSINGPIKSRLSENNPWLRSNGTPSPCLQDTSEFPAYGTTAYNSVSIKKGQSLGQFYNAPQDIKVSGFKFYGFAIPPSSNQNVKIRAICNLYKAGADSLPTGTVLASDTVELDTVLGSSIPLSRITRFATFKKPVTINSPYIICVESDSTNVSLGVVTNSWSAGNGRKTNLGCGSVSGKWYRCLNLNISGVTFDAHMQFYPFVKYKLATDFTMSKVCYSNDTVRFTNLHKNNVSSSPFYNYYVYYNLEQYSHRWNVDNSYYQNGIDFKNKYTTKQNYNVSLITSFWQYQTSSQCIDTMTKEIYFLPDQPTIKRQSTSCRGDNVTIDINGNGYVSWFKKVSDVSPFFIGNSYTINNIQKADTFYVKGINNQCYSGWLTVIVPVNEYPNNPLVTNDSICLGANANLQAKSNIGRINWFSASTGGPILYTGNSLTTPKLFADTSFYVEAENSGCLNKGGRVLVTAKVGNNYAPAKPLIRDTFTCRKSTGTFTLSVSYTGADTLRWFDVPSGGQPIDIGLTHNMSPTLRGDYTYYVEAWNGQCGSGREPITVHVYDYSAIFGKADKTICLGDTAKFSLGVSQGNLLWYSSKAVSTPDYIGKSQAFGGLTKTTTFYLKTEEGGCTSPNFDSVKVTVNAPPTPTLVSAPSVCAKALGVMTVNVPTGQVNWYDDVNATAPVYTGNTLNLGSVLSNFTYYYETTDKGCKSPKTPLTLTIKPRPVAGFTWTLAWQNKVTCIPITTSGLSFVWYWGDGGTSTTATAQHVYASWGDYTIRQVATSQLNGCKDTADILVNVTHLGTNTITKQNYKIGPNPVVAGQSLIISGITEFTHSEYMILNINGKVIAKGKIDNNNIVIPQNISQGIYLLRIDEKPKPSTTIPVMVSN